ncbi:MAG TPA: type II secretion system F family protein [Thermomicrobiales bacterium]|jgi:tight adherence protein C|nr:type II secretion system F family protein [Thermomicrobiales bacterium]
MVTVLVPATAFLVVFCTVIVLGRRSQRTILQVNRHAIVPAGVGAVAIRRERVPILGTGGTTAAGQWAARMTRKKVRTASGKLLREAGSPMPLATYLLLRVLCTFVIMPAFVIYIWHGMGASLLGIMTCIVGGFTIPQLPLLRIKRKARRRATDIERAMPDALDLLVVCAEGGLSLDGAIQQVSQRTRGVLADELRRLLQEIGSGMPRRDAFLSLGDRSQSESLKIFTATIIQADKMGMSIANTLRTLADTMRTRRRLAAETQARKAPIKMMPFLVIFMIPSLFIVILGPAVLAIIQFMRDVSKM